MSDKGNQLSCVLSHSGKSCCVWLQPDFLRLRQVMPGSLDATFGGGELNVAVSVAQQGGESAFLTALPDNELTDALEQELRKIWRRRLADSAGRVSGGSGSILWRPGPISGAGR